MVELLRPARGGFLRPFGCGWFIREYLLGKGPYGSTKIDPIVGAPQADIWGRIENDLKKDDVSSASGRLRQNCEQFFAMLCDSLQAPVVYKLTGTYEFGNLLDGAVHQYGSLLAQAKKAAQSWGQA